MNSVPSEAPRGLTVVASTSTSIALTWQLPLVDFQNGIITGFRLFFKQKGLKDPLRSVVARNTIVRVTGLIAFTEYEFQVLAFTSVGDGPKCPVVVARTKRKEDGE